VTGKSASIRLAVEIDDKGRVVNQGLVTWCAGRVRRCPGPPGRAMRPREKAIKQRLGLVRAKQKCRPDFSSGGKRALGWTAS